MSDYSLYIGGQAVPGASTMDVINPATEEVIVACPRADGAQLDAAVAAAKAAFPAWEATPIEQRRAVLLQIADVIEGRLEEVARTVTLEQGKPLQDAREEVFGAIYMMRTFASFDIKPRTLKEDATGKVVEFRTALGVVASIMPWNVPVAMFVVKIVPAIMAGNTVVAKPAPTTPLSSLLLGGIFNAHLPAGVFNIITDQNDLGGALTAHPDVRKVAFTGSTATGKKVLAAAAPSLKRVTLELGGNDAAIILDDADPKIFAPKVFKAAMVNCGQICLAAKRIFVPEHLYEAYCAEFAKLAAEAVVGDGMDPGTQIGPLQNRMQYEKVKGFLDDARKTGRIVAGGELPQRRGYFIPPTIVRDIADSARLVCEEQFGPVMPVLTYKSIDEVIARANDSEYGLGGTVWTSNPERGLQVAMRMRTGLLWVNDHLTVDPTIPVGGAKQSGLGLELGPEGFNEFTQRHVVYVSNAV